MVDRLLNVLRPFTKTEFNQLIFFVTAKCNLKCRNCFNWQNLNHGQDLSLSEIKKISASLPKFKVLLISGGEPFLRKDLAKVVKIFREQNGIIFVGIPTNGTVGINEVKTIRQLLQIDPALTISLYFSLDGMEKFHDWSRGVEGSFIKTINLIKEISQFKNKFANLSVNINTVISGENIKEIPLLAEFMESKMKKKIEGHYFEIVRGSPREANVKNIDKAQLEETYNYILNYQKKVYQNKGKNKLFNKILSQLASSTVQFLYKTQYKNYFNNQKWPMTCVAGKGISVLGSQGQLSFCELRDQIINVRDIDYDVGNFLHSSSAINEFNRIKKAKCFCTHGCFISESMYKSPKVVFWELPIIFVKNIFGNHF